MDNLLLAMWLPGKIPEVATVIPRTATSLFYCPLCRGISVQFALEWLSSLPWNACPVCSGIRIKEHNDKAEANKFPVVELAPLPASAQFLNVIESVFSGMARAIIHSSNYESTKAAMEAIDRHFKERNLHFLENPKRAGNKIWGMERTSSEFSASNNCKDPAYR